MGKAREVHTMVSNGRVMELGECIFLLLEGNSSCWWADQERSNSFTLCTIIYQVLLSMATRATSCFAWSEKSGGRPPPFSGCLPGYQSFFLHLAKILRTARSCGCPPPWRASRPAMYGTFPRPRSSQQLLPRWRSISLMTLSSAAAFATSQGGR